MLFVGVLGCPAVRPSGTIPDVVEHANIRKPSKVDRWANRFRWELAKRTSPSSEESTIPMLSRNSARRIIDFRFPSHRTFIDDNHSPRSVTQTNQPRALFARISLNLLCLLTKLRADSIDSLLNISGVGAVFGSINFLPTDRIWSGCSSSVGIVIARAGDDGIKKRLLDVMSAD